MIPKAEAFRILKPGGTIVFADTPQDDLFTYRGFYEPWKDQWLNFDCEQSLKSAGFTDIVDHGIVGGDAVLDCNGICNGTSIVDDCGI